MDKLLDALLPVGAEFVKWGQIDEKMLIEVPMMSAAHRYTGIVTDFYGEDEDYRLDWTDIEGYGFGWAWATRDESEWPNMFFEMCKRETADLLKEWENTMYVVYRDNGILVYKFIVLYDAYYRKDVKFLFYDDERFGSDLL